MRKYCEIVIFDRRLCSALSSCVFFHAPPCFRVSHLFTACPLPLLGSFLRKCFPCLALRLSSFAVCPRRCSVLFFVCYLFALAALPRRLCFCISPFLLCAAVVRRCSSWVIFGFCLRSVPSGRLSAVSAWRFRRFCLFCPFCLLFFLVLAWMSSSALISFLPA